MGGGAVDLGRVLWSIISTLNRTKWNPYHLKSRREVEEGNNHHLFSIHAAPSFLPNLLPSSGGARAVLSQIRKQAPKGQGTAINTQKRKISDLRSMNLCPLPNRPRFLNCVKEKNLRYWAKSTETEVGWWLTGSGRGVGNKIFNVYNCLLFLKQWTVLKPYKPDLNTLNSLNTLN